MPNSLWFYSARYPPHLDVVPVEVEVRHDDVLARLLEVGLSEHLAVRHVRDPSHPRVEAQDGALLHAADDGELGGDKRGGGDALHGGVKRHLLLEHFPQSPALEFHAVFQVADGLHVAADVVSKPSVALHRKPFLGAQAFRCRDHHGVPRHHLRPEHLHALTLKDRFVHQFVVHVGRVQVEVARMVHHAVCSVARDDARAAVAPRLGSGPPLECLVALRELQPWSSSRRAREVDNRHHKR
mmetsp:Transcript_58214/g.114452  ORF Transcript_58214/g.114452 Transcript_58214/m.114452 type:complete len:240 (-) Transcript_58214:385-1104(-)